MKKNKSLIRHIPNILTASRVVLAILLVGAFYIQNQTTIIILAAIAFFTELIDGPIARYFNVTSQGGKEFDAHADLFLFIVFLLGIVFTNQSEYAPYELLIVSVFAGIGITALYSAMKLKKVFLSNHLFFQRLSVFIIFLYGLYAIIAGFNMVLFSILIISLHIANIEQILFIVFLQNEEQEKYNSVWELVSEINNYKQTDNE
jgi:phosphatidylglycerophosphate synthase